MPELPVPYEGFSPVTRERLRRAGARRDPTLTCSRAELRRLLLERSWPELDSAIDFEERYGGLCVGKTIYGAYSQLVTDATWSTPPDDEEPHLVPISRTGDSALFIDAEGRIWLLELIAMPEVVPYAASFEVLVERDTARMGFYWDAAVHQITMTGIDVASELATLMKVPLASEASDELETFWSDGGLTIVSSRDWDRILNGRDGAPMRPCTYIYTRDGEIVEAVAVALKEHLSAPEVWSREEATRKHLGAHLPLRFISTTEG